MHRKFLSLCCCLYALACTAQKNYGIGQDYYLYRKSANGLVPSVYYQTAKSWYGQMRFNYEEEQTLSVHAGKAFGKEGVFAWTITPQAGLLAGRFTGGSATVKAEAEAGVFSFYTEPQYCIPFGGEQQAFFYNWSEVCVQPLPFLYTGLAVQQTMLQGERPFTEPGLVLGLELKNLELPFYFFKPKGGEGYFVVGVHWKLQRD